VYNRYLFLNIELFPSYYLTSIHNSNDYSKYIPNAYFNSIITAVTNQPRITAYQILSHMLIVSTWNFQVIHF